MPPNKICCSTQKNVNRAVGADPSIHKTLCAIKKITKFNGKIIGNSKHTRENWAYTKKTNILLDSDLWLYIIKSNWRMSLTGKKF